MTTTQQSGPQAHYLAMLGDGRFLIQRCTACRRHIFVPRVICPHCSSDAWTWVEPRGTGVVYSTTTVRRKGGDYDVSVIELDEGVRMMSRVEGLPPAQVEIGMRVRARVTASQGAPLVVFVAE